MLIRLSELMTPIKALTRPYKGVVVDNADPLKLGRIKCSVQGLFPTDASNDKLPWVISVIDPSKFDVPEVGQEVVVDFPTGDIHIPRYVGFWHGANKHDSYFDSGYPNSFGINKQGFKMKFNKSSKEGEILHPSGAKVTVAADGTLSIESPTNIEIKGTAGSTFGDSSSVTNINGQQVLLAGGGKAVAVLGSLSKGTGNLAFPVISQVIQGSSKVFAN